MRRRDFLKFGGAAAAGVAVAPAVLGSESAAATTPAAPNSRPVLPQHDTLLGEVARTAALAQQQLTYLWTDDAPNLPGVPMAAYVPLDDQPTIEWLLEAATVVVNLLINFVDSVIPQFTADVGAPFSSLRSQLGSVQTSVAAINDSFQDLVTANNGKRVTDPISLARLAALQASLQTNIGRLNAIRSQVTTRAQQAFTAGTGIGDFGSADGLERYNAMWSTLPIPDVAANLHDDDLFAYLRVGGPNPMLLTKVSGAPPAALAITGAQYQQVMGGSDSLVSAISDGRLFVCDYASLGPLAPSDATYKLLTGTGYNSAPIALFAVPAGGGPLQPVAIQCGQDAGTSPLFLRPAPDDANAYWSWQMAKTVVQTADFNYHEMYVHLGRTHLVSEAFCLATHRHLAPTHPLNVLLVPHFEGDLFINELAALIIMGTDTFGDVILAAPIEDAATASATDRLAWDFYAHMPPAEFAARGVDDADVLSEYPYRDDALLIWSAIHDWVSDYLAVYYASDRDVTGDTELSAWVTELIKIGKIKGFKPITTRAQLADVATMIVFTASAQHAAVNYPQRDLMTYAPFFAGVDAAPPPTATTGATQADWIKLLPSVFGSLAQLYFLNLLGGVYYRPLGDYRANVFPYAPWLTDTRVTGTGGPLASFQAALAAAGSTIGARNGSRRRSYEYLLPSQIPTSTNI